VFEQQGVTKLNSFKAETIYRNETAMAYGAAQFAKLQTVSKRFPYWQYTTAHDERVRESHRVLDGKIFLASDSEYYPPLGFNCRCRAIPISVRQAESKGIKGPDTVTAEMRATLANADFIGDKVGNFADWLNVKMPELPVSTQTLITEKLAEIQGDAQAVLYDTYKTDSNYKTITSNTNSGLFVVRHAKADKADLKTNLDAAKRLFSNDYSVVVLQHQLGQNIKNPEFLIIKTDGTQYISDLKTPDPTKYNSIENGIRNSFRTAARQKISHVTIDIVADESLEHIAVGIQLAFEKYAQIRSTIILKGSNAVEVTRADYMTGKVLEVLQKNLE